MEELIEIKTEKEKYMNELEKLRLDVFREKNLLDSFIRKSSLQERNSLPNLETEIPQYSGKSVNGKVSPKTDPSNPLPLPTQLQRQRSITSRSPNPEDERSDRNVPPLSSSRPGTEPSHDHPDYRQGLPDSLTHSLYLQMMETGGRLPDITRLSDMSTPYGLPPPGQYSRVFPSLPSLGSMAYSGHPVTSLPMPHPIRSPPQPHPVLSPPKPQPVPGSSKPPPGDLSESSCEACGGAANFMCSACKGTHYCSTYCQVT